MMGYIHVWEHLEVVDILMLRSPIFEDLYSPVLDFRIFVWLVCSSLC